MSPREAARALGAQDSVFLLFLRAVFVLMVLYGGGMMAVVLWGNSTIAGRMVNGFLAMFSAVIGLGSGYLLGARAANGGGPAGSSDG